MRWRSLFRPGDWLVAAVATVFCAATVPLMWTSGVAAKAVVKRGGEVFAELDLARNRRIDVPGPLGITTVAVEKHRVRVVADPGPRQYCVRQGWLTRASAIAICAPNQVSVQVLGSKEAYDSLSY